MRINDSQELQIDQTAEPAVAGKRSAANFVDPLGLARRMLFGKNPIGRSLLWREALRQLTRPLDWWLSHKEPKWEPSAPQSLPILFIVGGPRAGSTFFYQVITQCFHVSSFQNLIELFPNSAMTVTRWWSRDGAPQSGAFKSFFGNTQRMREVNDGFPIWDKFLGDDRYTVDLPHAHERAGALKNYLDRWQMTFPIPFVNKNNRNTDCLQFLADVFPRARFAVVQRDPFFEGQSLILARQFVQGSKRIPWGLYSRSVPASQNPLGYVEEVAAQLKLVRSRVEEQLARINDDRYLFVDYENLCSQPQSVVEAFKDKFPEFAAFQRDALPDFASFRESRTVKLEDDEAELLRNLLNN